MNTLNQHNRERKPITLLRLVSTIAALFLSLPTLGQSFSESQSNELDALFADAQKNGLPVAYLEIKRKEGLAKRIPPERLAVALKIVAGQLSQAQRWLVNDFRMAMPVDHRVTIAAAQTLRSGIPLDAVAAALRHANNRGLAMEQALLLAGDLATRGVPADVAVTLTEQWATKGKPGDDRMMMETLERLTQTPGNDVRNAAHQIRDRVLDARDTVPFHSILESLGRPPGWALDGGNKGPALVPMGSEGGAKAAAKKDAVKSNSDTDHIKKNKGFGVDNKPDPHANTNKPDKPNPPGKTKP